MPWARRHIAIRRLHLKCEAAITLEIDSCPPNRGWANRKFTGLAPTSIIPLLLINREMHTQTEFQLIFLWYVNYFEESDFIDYSLKHYIVIYVATQKGNSSENKIWNKHLCHFSHKIVCSEIFRFGKTCNILIIKVSMFWCKSEKASLNIFLTQHERTVICAGESLFHKKAIRRSLILCNAF